MINKNTMTTIVDLLSSEPLNKRRNIFLSAILAGIANTMVMAIVSSVATAPKHDSEISFLGFILSIGVFVLGTRYTFYRINEIIQSALVHIKERLVQKAERLELESLERIGAPDLYRQITENVTVVAN